MSLQYTASRGVRAHDDASAESRLRARAAELRVTWEEAAAGDAEHDQLRPEPRGARYPYSMGYDLF